MHTNMKTVSLPVCKCRKCTYEWVASTQEIPTRCANPQCRTPYWQTERVVYVRKTDVAGVYKIGATSNINKRFPNIYNQPVILCTIKVGNGRLYHAEKALHRIFMAQKVRKQHNCELFRLSKIQVGWIRRVAAMESPLDEIYKAAKATKTP